MKRFLSRLTESFKKFRKPNQTLAQRLRTHLMVESLEERKLLSASPAFYWKLSSTDVDPNGLGQISMYDDSLVDKTVVSKNTYYHTSNVSYDMQSGLPIAGPTISSTVQFSDAPDIIKPGIGIHIPGQSHHSGRFERNGESYSGEIVHVGWSSETRTLACRA